MKVSITSPSIYNTTFFFFSHLVSFPHLSGFLWASIIRNIIKFGDKGLRISHCEFMWKEFLARNALFGQLDLSASTHFVAIS